MKFYMVAEHGSITEHYDGVCKSWDEFEFDTINSIACKFMTDKSEQVQQRLC